MLFLNLGIGWIITLKCGAEALHIERLRNDARQNVVLSILGTPAFYHQYPSQLCVAPPGRLDFEHSNRRLTLYITRKTSGIRIAWRDQDFFTILRHKGREMFPTAEVDPVAYIHLFTHNRIRDLTVDFEKDAVILTGRCASFHAKQLAQEAALKYAENVVNKITVGRIHASLGET